MAPLFLLPLPVSEVEKIGSILKNDHFFLGDPPSIRSQNGTTTTSIVNDDDETLSLGITPALIAAEIREDADGILRKRVISNTGTESWVVC